MTAVLEESVVKADRTGCWRVVGPDQKGNAQEYLYPYEVEEEDGSLEATKHEAKRGAESAAVQKVLRGSLKHAVLSHLAGKERTLTEELTIKLHGVTVQITRNKKVSHAEE